MSRVMEVGKHVLQEKRTSRNEREVDDSGRCQKELGVRPYPVDGIQCECDNT